jgi:hypothetical protein
MQLSLRATEPREAELRHTSYSAVIWYVTTFRTMLHLDGYLLDPENGGSAFLQKERRLE